MPSSTSDNAAADERALPSLAATAPLKDARFRMLWCTWLVANVCMWMNEVASAWMMMAMTASPMWVALVQTASTLPVFLLGLPSGALADMLDRRRYFLVAQFWLMVVAFVLCLVIVSGRMTPVLLLALTFANGVGMAMRWPVFAAIVPGLVPRVQLPAALALNGVAMNVSRIIGPLVAGALIAGAGSVYVFMLNALLSALCALVILRWRYQAPFSPPQSQHLFKAIGAGVQFVRHAADLRAVLLRIFLFFFHSTALLALLPLVARSFRGGDASIFTSLLASMGAGTVVAALFLPRLRLAIARDTLVTCAAVLHSAATLAVAFAPNVYVASTAMFVGGMAWLTVANALIVAAQLALPDWVRARGMAMYQMAIMGGSAAGAALWGQIAGLGSVQISLIAAALAGAVAMLLSHRRLDGGSDIPTSK